MRSLFLWPVFAGLLLGVLPIATLLLIRLLG
jgi:hypothetical protein